MGAKLRLGRGFSRFRNLNCVALTPNPTPVIESGCPAKLHNTKTTRPTTNSATLLTYIGGVKHWLWSVAIAGWAFAGPLEEGQFSVAYEQSSKAGGSTGWVGAARAANFYASYSAKGDAEVLAWFERARSAAQKALEADPRSAEAHFELARALGGTLHTQNLFSKANLAAVMRDHLNESLKLNPNLTEGKVALALWNLEVSESGLGWLYGADKSKVKPLFEEALRIDPGSIVVRTWYAEVLTRLGDSAQARIQLEKAVALSPRDAVERIEQGFARERLSKLK